MPDEMMNFLTLDRWGVANLDKWWKYMGMNLSLENGDELELDEQEKWRRGPSGR